MHNKEHQKQKVYYKELGKIIKKYDEVHIFEPTDAKVELFNMLQEVKKSILALKMLIK